MRCCICGKEFEGYGNNPYPLCYKEDYESKCCNECNDAYVIQARLLQNSDSPINTLVNKGKFLAGYAEECNVQGNWTGSWGHFILDKEDSYKIGD